MPWSDTFGKQWNIKKHFEKLQNKLTTSSLILWFFNPSSNGLNWNWVSQTYQYENARKFLFLKKWFISLLVSFCVVHITNLGKTTIYIQSR